jgi:hypothetical protein
MSIEAQVNAILANEAYQPVLGILKGERLLPRSLSQGLLSLIRVEQSAVLVGPDRGAAATQVLTGS